MAVMYQAGAFGQMASDDTNLLYWEMLKENKYPGAGKAIEKINAKIQKQQQMLASAQNVTAPTGPEEETTRNNGIDDRTLVQDSDLTNLAAMGVSL